MEKDPFWWELGFLLDTYAHFQGKNPSTSKA